MLGKFGPFIISSSISNVASTALAAVRPGSDKNEGLFNQSNNESESIHDEGMEPETNREETVEVEIILDRRIKLENDHPQEI